MTTRAILPKTLQPRRIDSLVRIGRDNDGGYLVDGRNVRNADALLGLGIGFDWSFEKQFYSQNPSPVYAYDGTLDFRAFARRLLLSLSSIYDPKKAFRGLAAVFGYRLFFRGDRRHIKKQVGMEAGPGYVSLSGIMQGLKSEGRTAIFLKVDIEGWEYRILDDLIAHSEAIEGLVAEFHDVDLHLGRIENFVRDFPLTLVHAHCNNSAPINGDGIPTVIELTFTRQPAEGSPADEFPHRLDMPNKPGVEDYILSFR